MNTRDPSPLPLRVRLPFASEEEFIRRFGPNLSPGGIFIPTKALKPEGTQLRFELVLTDGTRLLRGSVVVQRALEASPTQRGGMELAFTELDGPSHVVLERVLQVRDAGAAPAMVSEGHLLSGRMQSPQAPASGLSPQPARAPGPTTSGAPVPRPPPPASPLEAPVGPVAADTPVASTPVPSPPPSAGAHAQPEAGATPLPEGHLVPQAQPSLAEEAAELARAAALAEEAAALAAAEGPQAASDVPPPPALDPPSPTPARGSASAAQRSARAERIEGLARASAQGVDAQVARARQQETVTVVAFSFDHPDAGIGRLEGGRYRHLPTSDAPGRSPTLRLLAREANAPRVLEFAGAMGLVPGHGGDGFSDWDDGLGRMDGTQRAAHWLESALARADALTPGVARRPVLAIPLHAGHVQRELWHRAARRVGLEQLLLVSSPLAAALAYAQGRGFARRRMLVLSMSDLGFDAAVVQITGDDVEAISAAGDPFVGNAEFDARMLFGVRQTLRMRGLVAPEITSPEGRALMAACAAARLDLDREDHALFVFDAQTERGTREPVTFEYSRAEADAPVHDLVERIAGLVREVLDDAKLSAAGVDGVLVLGHTAHSPLLRRRLSTLLERSLGDADEQPTSLVAHGAALYGEAQLRSESGRPHVHSSEVLSVPLAIAERSGALRVALDRGTRLPVTKTLAIPSTPGVPLAVVAYQGAADRAEADLLGTAVCTPEMPGEVEVRFRVARDGRVAVTLHPPGGGSTPLIRAPLEADRLGALLQQAPEGPTPPPDGGGLLVGLRRLFRKA